MPGRQRLLRSFLHSTVPGCSEASRVLTSSVKTISFPLFFCSSLTQGWGRERGSELAPETQTYQSSEDGASTQCQACGLWQVAVGHE